MQKQHHHCRYSDVAPALCQSRDLQSGWRLIWQEVAYGDQHDVDK
jgi:hypothetical protein